MDIPRHWRLKKQRYSLTGEVCDHCDAKLFPPRDICPECGEEEVVIPKIEELHGVIAKSISKRPGQLQPREIRFLRTFLGYSSVDFARLLGVTPETVSRWEKLRNPQKMAKPSERLLRMLAQFAEPSRTYDLEQILLPDSARSGPWALRFSQAGGEWALNEAY